MKIREYRDEDDAIGPAGLQLIGLNMDEIDRFVSDFFASLDLIRGERPVRGVD